MDNAVNTLGDMSACRRRDRRGRLSIAHLIPKHGRGGYGELRRLIAYDCPKMQKPSSDIYDRCGAFSELARWF